LRRCRARHRRSPAGCYSAPCGTHRSGGTTPRPRVHGKWASVAPVWLCVVVLARRLHANPRLGARLTAVEHALHGLAGVTQLVEDALDVGLLTFQSGDALAKLR